MPITVYRGERSVAEIVDRMYVRLTPRQREIAEATVLSANPELRNLRTLRAGTILRIPNVPELNRKVAAEPENPDRQIAARIADSLAAYQERVDQRIAEDAESTRNQLAVLNDAAFQKEIGHTPDLQELANAASKALDARAKSVKERQAVLKSAIDQARKDLETPLR